MSLFTKVSHPTERETERQAERDRDRETHRERERERQTETERDRDRDRDRPTPFTNVACCRVLWMIYVWSVREVTVHGYLPHKKHAPPRTLQ